MQLTATLWVVRVSTAPPLCDVLLRLEVLRTAPGKQQKRRRPLTDACGAIQSTRRGLVPLFPTLVSDGENNGFSQKKIMVAIRGLMQ